MVFIPVKQREDVSPKFIWQLILDDASEAICSKYVSRRAWTMAKIKLVRKLAVQCPASMLKTVARVFRDRDSEYELAELAPDIPAAAAVQAIAKTIEKTKKRCVAIVSEKFSPEVATAADVRLEHGKRGSLWFGGATAEATSRSLI